MLTIQMRAAATPLRSSTRKKRRKKEREKDGKTKGRERKRKKETERDEKMSNLCKQISDWNLKSFCFGNISQKISIHFLFRLLCVSEVTLNIILVNFTHHTHLIHLIPS
jgi:hypothetical protein